MPNTHLFENGCRIIYEKPQTNLPITTIYVFCDYGSAYEYDGARGAAHLIEHMVFKGTKKIRDSKKIFIEFDKMGAYVNAYTEKRYTCYKIKCTDESASIAVHTLSDMLFNSVFNPVEYDKEYAVVLEENSKDIDDPEEYISESMDKMLYQGSSYAYPVDTLSYHKHKLKLADIFHIYKQFYQPKNMVISIMSNIPMNQLVRIIKSSYFGAAFRPDVVGSEATTSGLKSFICRDIIPQTDIQYMIKKDSGSNTIYLGIGFRTCNHYSTDKYVLELLKFIVSGPMSSRLFMLLREKNGLTYTSFVDTTYYEHMGEFSFYAETLHTKIIKNENGKNNGVLPIMIQLINDLIMHGVTDQEVRIIKGYIKGKINLQLEKENAQVEHNGIEMIMRKDSAEITSYRKYYERFFKHITKQDINMIIKKYFKKSNMCVSIIGEHLPSKNIIQKYCEEVIQ